MDISFSTEHERFSDEVKTFLGSALTEDLKEAQRCCPGIFLDYEHNIQWHHILYEKGWIAPAWPVEYGGTGWDLTQRYIWSTENTLAGAPSLAPMGLGMCGPMLIGHGSPEQKAHYLPRILSGEDYWCQGYSEPSSGSDLASLKLNATSDGDEYVLNGSKIWTTHAHFANMMFLLVRTNPQGKPQQGITFILLDMTSPGIDVQPIVFASGTHEVNQVFFDNVRVPKSNIVGQENQGWTVAKYLLEFERGGGGSASFQAALARLRSLAEGVRNDGQSLAQDRDFSRKLDACEVNLQAIQFTEFRIQAALSKGQNPGPESSIMKNFGANMGQRLSELAVEAMAFYAQVDQGQAQGQAMKAGTPVQPIGPGGGKGAFSRYFNLRASSIAGGTNEVQKNIVAKLVLGL
ncbi:MAG: acyl-CoA dehydrogenase family protein [Proteobacteria bacterium]|nr:acyl-CoA dehydrogenase family protein [Pseudomonadota bacterium]